MYMNNTGLRGTEVISRRENKDKDWSEVKNLKKTIVYSEFNHIGNHKVELSFNHLNITN